MVLQLLLLQHVIRANYSISVATLLELAYGLAFQMLVEAVGDAGLVELEGVAAVGL